jgi:crotonobetainyl-CoA:carnitine CoA-transferase CaiB-like acyl-CoA transferase
VCHQTVSLAARLLEANGIPTVIMGCAKDIVEHCGVPRFLFSDFPLGNSAGRPHDVESQTLTLELALRVYQRTHTGRGQFVDVAMLDAALAFIPGPVSEYTVAGIEQTQIGNGSVSRKPTANRFRAKDGYIVLAVLTERQFASLMTAIGRPDALLDPRFKDWAGPTEHVAALREVIEGALARDDPKTWETRLTAADVPCASIWKIDEIVEHPQLEHRDVLQTIDSRYGPLRLVGAGFRLAHGSPGLDRQPPTLGEHTDEIPGRGRLHRLGDLEAPTRRRRMTQPSEARTTGGSR